MTKLKLRDSYGNSKQTGFSIDFFSLSAPGSSEAFLASPFVSTYEPVKLLTDRGCKVNLVMRLCAITTPQVLRMAINDPLVSVKYYTSRKFHAKLYIVDDVAMVGSANLTVSGLQTNREVSVVLRKGEDAAFDDLCGMFNLFWDMADVFTSDLCDAYEKAYRQIGASREEEDIQSLIEQYVPPVNPPTADVGSEVVTKKRSFLQNIRKKYDEKLIPAFREVAAGFERDGRRRPEFESGSLDIEVGRFLGWLRLVHAPGDSWQSAPIRDEDARRRFLSEWLEAWFSESDTDAGDNVAAENEVANITRVRESFSSTDRIAEATYEDIFEALKGVHAFNDRLRHVAGGIHGLKAQFLAQNGLASIQTKLVYLLHGPGPQLERAYDCIFSERWKMAGFGEACVMELVGWTDKNRAPINGRTIKALRFLGFSVKE